MSKSTVKAIYTICVALIVFLCTGKMTAYATDNIQAGSVSEYLTETGDYDLYPITLESGVYLQARLTQPSDPTLDYDLYLMDSSGNFIAASEYETYINGTTPTLQESIGYMPSGNEATYYIVVLSASGGSSSAAYTLDYSVCNVWSSEEPNENMMETSYYSLNSSSLTISGNTLGSPIDNDWIELSIPNTAEYSSVHFSYDTSMTNDIGIEVYENLSNTGYKMNKISSGRDLNVTAGSTYYVRIFYDGTLENFDETEISEVYDLFVSTVYSPTVATIDSIVGTMGNQKVNYPGYGYYYRTGQGTITVSGRATYNGSTASNQPAAFSDLYVYYYNPYWAANNTSNYASAITTCQTDANGNYTAQLQLPPPMGGESIRFSSSTQYFDVCYIFIFDVNNLSQELCSEPFIYVDRSDYN